MQPKHYKHATNRITKVKCNAATCLIRPKHVGPKPDWIRQVSLYAQGYMMTMTLCQIFPLLKPQFQRDITMNPWQTH